MGLRCSLLGHTYGEPEVEREREERGDEVVVAVRELRSCSRCGTETVVSENTEVRPIEPAPDPDDGSGTVPGDDADVHGTAQTPDAAPDDRPGVDDATPPADVGVEDEFDPPPSEEDDAVILEDDGDQDVPAAERQPGEWPAADDTRLDEASAGASDASAAGSPPHDADDADGTDDAATVWSDTDDAGTDSRAPTDASSSADPRGGVVGGDATGVDATSGIASASPVNAGVGRDDVDPDAAFECPSCEFSEPAMNSSHREGDICPECRQGYLTERAATRN